MKSTHKRNVTAMQAAPRCQSNTAAGLPCKKPALKGMPLCQSHAFWPAAPKPRAARAADQRRAYVELQQEIRRKVRDIERLARWARLNEVPDHFIDSLSEIGTGLAELAEADAPKRNTAGGRPRVNAEAPNPFPAGSSAQSAAKPSIAELSTERTRDRALGAMLGLAVGEAFGVTTAGFERGTFREMTEMYGQGKLGLNRGEWAWDTAAMLALTDTLLENPAFDARDYLERLVEHRDHRSYSPGSKPIRPGNMTALALSRFEQFDELFAIEQPTVRPTNGCLARIAPVAVRYWKQPDTMSEIAARQARTTHGGDGVEELSRSFAEAIALAIADHGRTALLSGRFWEKRWGRTLTFGELSQVPEDRILSDEDARGSFDAALWCVATGDGFNGALLNARNLGGDATSIGAMAGQLAGALYGARAIRRDWLECIAGREFIERAALKLFDAGMAEAGSS